MIGWVLMAREVAWDNGAGAPCNWAPSNSVRRVLASFPPMTVTFTAASSRYWRLFNEAEHLGFGQTVSGDSE